MNNDIDIKRIMLSIDSVPTLLSDATFKDVIDKMNEFKLGIVCIINDNYKLIGVLTDGDIRRRLIKSQKPISALFLDEAKKYCIRDPQTVKPEMKLVDAVKLMGEKQIWDLPVTDINNKLIGLLHLHTAISKILT
jgi:arabinose-5-phosphate isomerase